VEFNAEAGWRIEGAVERLTYRHDPRAAGRKIETGPAAKTDAQRFPLDLPGYGVALYRFHLVAPGAAPSPVPASR